MDCVVADAVAFERVSASNSLLTGKRTGIFSILGLFSDLMLRLAQ